MSDRREWTADDAAEVLAMFPDEPCRDQGVWDAVWTARHFGHEVVFGIPRGPGYWALEPRCVVGAWHKAPGDERWSCLRCYGVWAFSSKIEEEFLTKLRAVHSQSHSEKT